MSEIFNEDELQEIKDTLQSANRGQRRAAFGSIIRQNVVRFLHATVQERMYFLMAIGFSFSYNTEITKETALYLYEKQMGLIK
jgi:hypothetical protein